MLIKKDKYKDVPRKAAAERDRMEAALSDEELNAVAGGTGTANSNFWSADGVSTAETCSHGGSHDWEVSPGGNFKYCKKCHSEFFF